MCKVRVGTQSEYRKSLRGLDMFWAVFWIANLARGVEGGDWVQGAPKQKDQMDGKDSQEGVSELMGLMVRLMAGNWKKAEEVAFEGFISLVHVMCRVLIPGAGSERRHRAFRHSSLFGFIVKQPQVADLLPQMLDPDLIDHILKESNRKLKDHPRGNVDCIRLLTCKTKPFVRGMQTALGFFMAPRSRVAACSERGTRRPCPQNETEAAWEEAGLVDRMYFFMPALAEVVEHGDRCDELFPDCLY